MLNQPKHDIIRPLTGIRGLTIAWVVVFHFSGGIGVLAPALTPLLLLSGRLRFRVDLLFVLSGFLTAYVYVQRHEQLNFKAYQAFLWGRLIRFYPTYLAALVCLVLTVAIGRLAGFSIPDHYDLQFLPFRLMMLQAWPFCSWTMWSWNFPTWFLSALLFGYLSIVPCIWKLFPKLRASCLTLPLIFASILVFKLLNQFAVLSEFRAVLQACCEMMAGGALCALCLERKPFVAAMQRHLDKIVVLFVVSSVFVLRVSAPLALQVVNGLFVLACPILVAGLTAERSLTAKLLATRPFHWLGKISYSLFVCHAVVLIPLRGLLPPDRFDGSPPSVRYAVLAFYVFAIMIFTVAMYKLVEVPCARALKQLAAGGQANFLGKTVPIPQLAASPVEKTPAVLDSEQL